MPRSSTYGVNVPAFPAPAERYDRENEAQYRRQVERSLLDMVPYVEALLDDPDAAIAEHVLATTAGLGAQHTVSGLTAGQVLRAAGAAAAAFAVLNFSDLGGSIANAQVPESAVTQHQAALVLAASQVTSGQLALARGGTAADLSATGGASQVLRQSSAGAFVTVSQLAFSDLSGSIANAQVPESVVTQHQAALSIAETQIPDGSLLARVASAETVTGLWTFDRDPGAPFAVIASSAVVANLDADLLDGEHASAFADAVHTHAAADIASGTFADARIAASNVTQHQAALSIAETQIPDGTLLARVASAETVTGLWTFSRGAAVPFAVAAGALNVTNLDADLLDGNHAAAFALASHTHAASDITAAAFGAGAYSFSGGKVTLAAPVAGYATLNLPHGTAPSAPADGDVWTTTAGYFARVNGTTHNLTTAAAVGGSGTTGTVPKWTASTTLGDSIITESGTTVSVTGELRVANSPANYWGFDRDDTDGHLSITESGIERVTVSQAGAVSMGALTAAIGSTIGTADPSNEALTINGRLKGSRWSAVDPVFYISSVNSSTALALQIAGVDAFKVTAATTALLHDGAAIKPATAGGLTLGTDSLPWGRLKAQGADFSGNVLMAASTIIVTTASAATAGSGFRLPHGVEPTTSVNGDLWTTTGGLFVRINGVVKTVTLT